MSEGKEILFPSHFNVGSVHIFLDNVFAADSLPSKITFNFKDLCFIDPIGVTALANVTGYLVKHGVSVVYQRPDFSAYPDSSCYNAMKFLDDSGFFQKFLGKSLFPNPVCRSTTMPLRNIKYEEYYFWLEDTVIPWLNGRLTVDIHLQMPEFSVCLNEIFNNVNDHSGEHEACVFMQHFPMKNTVHIAISDFGVGIPQKVKRFLNTDISDEDAIKKAMEDGFSTKSTPANRGAGLDTLLRNVVENNQGELNIFSGNGAVRCGDGGVFPCRSGRYPGTLVDIRLRTDTLKSAEAAREDFVW